MTEKSLTKPSQDITSSLKKPQANTQYVRPAVDISETDEGLKLVADMPGLDEKSLDISIDKGILTLEGHAPAGHGDLLYREFNMTGYWRQFHLPDTLDVSKAKAEINNGVLTLFLPKEETVKPRRIEITTH